MKPVGWSHTAAAPLDPTYGAGVLNVCNSYEEMIGGRFGPAPARLSAPSHAPLLSGTAIQAQRGWDYRGITSNTTEVGISHYRFAVSGTGALIATLVWDKWFGAKAINRLSLYAYDSGGNLLGSSTSAVDNVQHLYVTGLQPGTYEIQVVKTTGRTGEPGVVGPSETYSLAWDFER